MMALEEHGPDTYVGVGPRYVWGGLYGGQIVAQGLYAASATVDDAYRIHSLHAYFIRSGDAGEPIRFEVDRIRNGRSLTTRRVVARQSVGAILNMAASYQVDEAAPEVQTAQMPEVPGPDEVIPHNWSPVFERRMLPNLDLPGRSTGWLRMSEQMGADPVLQACALAFLSDDLPTEAVIAQHPERPDPGGNEYPFWSASLDHAVWFHRPFAADEWHLHDFTCHGLMSSRGLAVGEVFTQAGRHVATVAQEVLLRLRREG
ncbi:MAG: Acyl-CoA thioesterase 2 [Acidimicrobiales bacterium]|nr:Acyl-CoA thioesterase 2 [Acidimicrobiales bacterium]